jgi:rare lipoprotein A
VVQITDRGPYVRGRGIDLSYAAARHIGIVERGVAPVRVEPIADDDVAPSDDSLAKVSETVPEIRALRSLFE